MAINAVGDTASLFGTSFGASRLGFVFGAIAWPTSMLVLSMSVWLRPRPSSSLSETCTRRAGLR